MSVLAGPEGHLSTLTLADDFVAPKIETETGQPGPQNGLGAVALVGPVVAPPVHEVYQKRYAPETGDLQVHVTSSVEREDYERITPQEDVVRLQELAGDLAGKNVMFVNATAAGGGVAIMRAPLMNVLNSYGVNASWYAMTPNKPGSEVTKWKFHNVMQAVAPEGTELTTGDEAVYESWVKESFELLKEPLAQADVIVIDDWQPSGLIPHIKGYDEVGPDGQLQHVEGVNPDAPILFRDHIHTRGDLMGTPGTPQHKTWRYLWEHNRINEADAFIVHPKDEFVPPEVPDEKVVFMPATCDLLDDLNRDISEAERAGGLAFINERLELSGQQPLDPARPYIALIARFDESKGMPQGIESYAKARQKMLELGVGEPDLPQFVVLGNGSVDDPSGEIVLQDIMRLRSDTYGDIQDDLKIVRVPHNDIAINALLKGAKVALQPSIAEGFESRVTDAILQGVPVIGSDRGGIPLQIEPGESGYVADPYDTESWSDYIVGLMTGPGLHAYMRRRAYELAHTKNYAFTTIPNAIRWLALSRTLLYTPDEFQGNRRYVEELEAVR